MLPPPVGAHPGDLPGPRPATILLTRPGPAPEPEPPPPPAPPEPRPAPQPEPPPRPSAGIVYFLEFLPSGGRDKSERPPALNLRPRDAVLEPPVGSGSNRLAGSASLLAPRAAFKLPPGRLQRARPDLEAGNGESHRPRVACTLLGETHAHHIIPQHKCTVGGLNGD